MGLRDIDRQIAEAVQEERSRVYELFLSVPWDGEDDSDIANAIKADRFELMRYVRDPELKPE
jgi:hypothetical protein